MGHLTTNPQDRDPTQKPPESSTPPIQTVRYAGFTAVNARLSDMIRAVVITSMLGILAIAPIATMAAQTQNRDQSHPDKPPLLTGKALQQRLKTRISVSWAEAGLADRLRTFAARGQFAIFIDRRIDPSLKINLQQVNVTVEQLLLDAADNVGISMCQIDDLIYIGPTATAQALPVLWEQLARASSVPAKPLEWATLSQPRELLESISRSAGFKIEGIEQVPHDLWDQGSLPALTPSQQVAIITVGFGLWPSMSETAPSTLKLARLPSPSVGKLEYVRGRRNVGSSSELKQILKTKFPEVSFQVTRDKVRMSGDTDKIYAAKAFLIRGSSVEETKPDSKDVRFTLKTSATRLQILNAVARQTGRELQFDPALRGVLAQQVEIECQQITLSELVVQILAGSELESRVTSADIQILGR